MRPIYFSYACHCVTLSNNKISGDWAGFAQDAVQKHFPGAIALASVGCGADSNPKSGVTGDKDHWKVHVCLRQLLLEIKTAQVGQADIEDETARGIGTFRAQKLTGRNKVPSF